jgi:hypothetical protein
LLQTHAHIDHAGLLPKLWKAGFIGPVFMTRGTRDLLSFMLPDSGHIHEMDVENLNVRYARRDKAQVAPIYTQEDAEVKAMRDELIKGGMEEGRVIAPVLDDEMELLADGPGPRSRPAPRRLQPEVIGRADWHNELAQFTLDLRDEFERAADDRSRAILMRRLRRALVPADQAVAPDEATKMR